MKYRIGVDIGGTGIKLGAVDENGTIVLKTGVKTPDSFEEAMRTIADMVSDTAEKLETCMEDLICVGVGVPCSVIQETGKLVLANKTSWKDVSIREELSGYLKVPLYFGNDANCAVIGETIAGAAKGKKNVVMLTLGTGVGGGIIINGKLFAGGDGLGAEAGHTPLVHDGIRCTCGIKGCFECYASATALIRQTKEAMERDPASAITDWVKENGEINGKTAFDCAKAGDRTAMDVVDTYAGYIANGLGGFVNIFRPELLILGGGISDAGDFLLDKIRQKLPEYVLAGDIIGVPPVKKALLGNDAGIIGAAYLDQL